MLVGELHVEKKIAEET